MNVQDVSRAKDKFLLMIVDSYTVAKNLLFEFISRMKPSSKVPEDFAVRTTPPSWDEYLQASNSQILERIYKNLPESINEQALIDKILILRNDGQHQRLVKHMAVGLYAIAIAVIVLAFKVPLGYSLHDIEAIAEKEAEYRKDLDLRLQSKEQEIHNLTQQVDQLQKNQEELTKEIISLVKSGKQPSKTASDKKQGKEKQRQ
jgi:hypothetical protein